MEIYYKTLISNKLDSNNDQIFLYWKGRIALFALLKAMGVKEGDEVILPSYTCVVVPNAILYLGASPVYVDIDPNTYNSDLNNIAEVITPKTKVIICQNTFGMSSNVDEIVGLAKENGLFTIEDCTHGFGGTYNGKPNGTYCDAAFYSTQWNKPFSTGLGGFALVNNKNLLESLKTINQNLVSPALFDRITLKFLYFVRKKLLVGSTYWVLVKLYRFLSKYNLVLGSSSGEEIKSVVQPKDYFKSISSVQIKEGLRNINKLPLMLDLRKKNARIYTEYLINHGKNHVPYNQFENHSFLKYPLLVKDRDYVIQLAEKKKIELGEWLNSPIHPIQKQFELWKLNPELYPKATFAGKHMINIPTDTHEIEKIIAFLNIIENHIFDA